MLLWLLWLGGRKIAAAMHLAWKKGAEKSGSGLGGARLGERKEKVVREMASPPWICALGCQIDREIKERKEQLVLCFVREWQEGEENRGDGAMSCSWWCL